MPVGNIYLLYISRPSNNVPPSPAWWAWSGCRQEADPRQELDQSMPREAAIIGRRGDASFDDQALFRVDGEEVGERPSPARRSCRGRRSRRAKTLGPSASCQRSSTCRPPGARCPQSRPPWSASLPSRRESDMMVSPAFVKNNNNNKVTDRPAHYVRVKNREIAKSPCACYSTAVPVRVM